VSNIPQSQAKHPVDLRFMRPELTIFLQQVNHGFGIAMMGPEAVASRQQILSKFRMVVNFTIKNHLKALVFVGDGLSPSLRVDNGQTSDSQMRLLIVLIAFIIRAPVNKAGAHPFQKRSFAFTSKTADSTHRNTNQRSL
jgi:hypothetical protein